MPEAIPLTSLGLDRERSERLVSERKQLAGLACGSKMSAVLFAPFFGAIVSLAMSLSQTPPTSQLLKMLLEMSSGGLSER